MEPMRKEGKKRGVEKMAKVGKAGVQEKIVER